MSLFLVSFSAILLSIINVVNVNGTCDMDTQTCGNDEHCIYQRAKVGYPDPSKNFQVPAYAAATAYACNSKSYCQWAQLWNTSCVQIYIPEERFLLHFYWMVNVKVSMFQYQ